MTPEEIHNMSAEKIMRSIIEPTMLNGGNYNDVLVLLESVMFGVLLFGERMLGGPPEAIEKTIVSMTDAVRARLEAERMGDAKGNA